MLDLAGTVSYCVLGPPPRLHRHAMNIRRQALALFFLVLSGSLAAPLGAKQHKGSGSSREGGMSQEEAAQIARKRTGGRVLSVKPAKDGYRVKVLTPQGEVRYVPVRR